MAECKYYKQRKQVSYDGGQTWSDLDEYQKGSYYSSGATECQVVSEPQYRWVRIEGYICQGTYKCIKLQKQVSYDNGSTWSDLDEYMAGNPLEGNSPDCGYSDNQYRWIDVTGYICDGTTKYGRQQKQVSYDSGSTWSNVYPEEFRSNGTVIETNSVDCGYIAPTYRWYTQSTYCDFLDLYGHQIRQISYDNGTTWENVSPEQTQEVLLQVDARACGAGEYKVLTNGHYVYCSSDTIITSGDVKGNTSDISRVTAVTIGTCATEISTNAFRGSSITEIDIPSNVTRLNNSTFAYCGDLTTVRFKSSTPPTIGTNTFTQCPSLQSIIVPCGSGNAYRAVSNLSSWSSKIVEDECGCVPSYTGDGITAYTASTVAQVLSIGTFRIDSCDYGVDYEAYQVANGNETTIRTSIDVLEATPVSGNMYDVEFGISIPSSTYSQNWNIHLIFFDMDTLENIYDYTIKSIRITRR